MEIFEGDEEKIKALDKMIANDFGFEEVYPVSTQTYPRKLDVQVLQVLSNICISVEKMVKDIRLLQHDKELEEPFEKGQIGSSAMAYKRNPMRSERAMALARYGRNQLRNAEDTAVDQWLERTLDDSANRRLSIPEAFLSTDSVLILSRNIVDGLVVYNKIIEKRLQEELPFMVTENIMMDAVAKGGNRQELHERIRKHSMEVGWSIKMNGNDNDLLERIAGDQIFGITLEEAKVYCNPMKLVGRCPRQVEDFLREEVRPVLEANKDLLTDINTKVSV